MPAVAVALGIVVLSEPFTAAGLALILGGTALSTARERTGTRRTGTLVADAPRTGTSGMRTSVTRGRRG